MEVQQMDRVCMVQVSMIMVFVVKVLMVMVLAVQLLVQVAEYQDIVQVDMEYVAHQMTQIMEVCMADVTKDMAVGVKAQAVMD